MIEEINNQVHRVIINIRHITLVQSFLNRITAELKRRLVEHDVTKFSEDEFLGFVQLNYADKLYGYGTPEYKAALADINAVGLHISRHSHHPEFYENGIDDMSLADIIEMVCDWKAANAVYGITTFQESVEKSCERFGVNDKQRYLIDLIVAALEQPE